MNKNYVIIAAALLIGFLWYKNYGPGLPAATS
jgi:hypothetical protein